MFTDKLAEKFIAPISLLIICAFTSLTLLFIRYEMYEEQDHAKLLANALSSNLSKNLKYGVLIKNYVLIDNLVNLMLKERGVISVRVLDNNGKILSSAGEKKAPFYESETQIFMEKGPDKDKNDEEDILFWDENAGEKEIIGTVYLAISLVDIVERFKRIRNISIGITSVLVIILIATILLIVKRVTFPIKELVIATRRVSDGDLGYRVKVRTNDEIGKLAVSFNKMTQDLNKTTVSKDYVDSIITSITDTLMVTNFDGTIKTVNQSALNLLGYKEIEILGRSISTFFVEDIINVVKWQDLLSGAKVNSYELTAKTGNGETIPVNFSVSVMRNKDGSLEGFVIVARDMRQIKQLQLQLLQSEKMASVGQLAAGVAHEINNPIAVILGFAQTLARDIKESDSLNMPLKSIEREAVRCKKLVGDLLTFSRVGRTEMEPCNINTVIDGALSLVSARTKIKNVNITTSYGENVPQIVINKNQIQQVIINLSNNAVDAMDDGGKLFISTSVDEDGKHVSIVVKDTGTGIPMEIQKKIFEPFFTTKEVGRGTGLGLSMCYEIINKHNATIELDSEPGKGATFTIRLPIKTS